MLWIVSFWCILAYDKMYLRTVPAIVMFCWYFVYILYEVIINYAGKYPGSSGNLSPVCVTYLPNAAIFSNFCF